MARKSTGNITTRSRKTTQPTESAAVQPIAAPAPPEVVKPEAVTNVKAAAAAAGVGVGSAMPTNGTHANGASNGANLDEEIRRRAYELYLQREGAGGDPVGDWFVAEREVRARRAAAGR